MERGEIRYENSDVPQRYGIINSCRPVVLLSAPHGESVQVVPLTTNIEKADGCNKEYHVLIQSSGRPSVALVEQIRTVPTSELSSAVIGRCDGVEMFDIGAAVRKLLLNPAERNLGLNPPPSREPKSNLVLRWDLEQIQHFVEKAMEEL